MDGIKGSRPPSTTALAAGGASAAPAAKTSREPEPTGWAPNAATPESSAPSAIEPDVRARGLQMVQAASAGVAPQNPASSVDDAFESLQASASGIAEIRRHTDNVMAWNMKWDLVNKAQKTFDFSYFSIERDAYGLAYLGALLNARLRGVEVTGVTDYMANSRGHGFASVGLGADYVQELATYGAKIGLYDKPSTRVENLFDDGASYRVISSDHDKLAVSDAGTEQAEGETGGRNVAGAYHQDPKDNPKSWRDDSVQIKGRVTDGLVVALRRELDGPAVKVVKPDVVNLDQRATEMLGAFSMMQAWLAAPPLSEAEKTAVRADPAKREALAAELYANGLAALRAMPEVPARLKNKALNVVEQHNLRTCAEELAADLELRGSKARYDVLGGYITGEVKIIDQVGAASAPVGERFNEFAPDMLKLIEGTQKEIVLENPYVCSPNRCSRRSKMPRSEACKSPSSPTALSRPTAR